MQDKIIVKGAREHNLKNINVEIPRDRLVVITGLSGSGKSSLAFDTIYAEGQRRYVESLSAYARQFLGQMEKPDVDYIEGLSPAISIDQKTTSRNPRSTVGTVTEIYDYLRLLFARVGEPHCPKCGRKITQQTLDQIIEKVLAWPEGMKIYIMAPLVRGKKGQHVKIRENALKTGYVRARVDGEVISLEDDLSLDKNKKHDIEIVVDRIVLKKGKRKRLAESLELALELGDGIVVVSQVEAKQDVIFSQQFSCPDCGISLPEITPRMFSFNSPYGACPACDGLGMKKEIDPEKIISDWNLSLAKGAIAKWNDNNQGWYYRIIKSLAKHDGFSLEVPLRELSQENMQRILYGTGEEKILLEYENSAGDVSTRRMRWEGVVPNFERRYLETSSGYIREELERYMTDKPCSSCQGKRLRPESLAVLIDGKNISEITDWSIENTEKYFQELKLSDRQQLIAKQLLKEIRERLSFLSNVGLNYLTLSRGAGSLSGGEAQRIRLATQIGSSLMGVLYILDEPSIGLHQRDNERLIKTLKHLRDVGNTVIVVEHDEDTMKEADFLIDIGPGAGRHGGEVVAAGSVKEVMKNQHSLTGQYLRGIRKITVPKARRGLSGKFLKVREAAEHNLKKIDVDIPLGQLVCVTGVSGSGKSTLVNDIIYRGLNQKINKSRVLPGKHKSLENVEEIEKVIGVDQSPIGRTPRSNPATYTGIFTDIRELYAMTPEAKIRGYKPGRFSFNVKGGRCEACQGDGIIKIEMHFLPDVYVACDACKGNRYNRETLEVHYKGKNIADVLDMTVDEAAGFFKHIPKIFRKLTLLQDVGLGYIKIGQSATTLSGGEAQRIKLASELSKRSTGKNFYILDEPTTGLHMEDVKKLLDVLNRLVEAGNTVLVIEHNLDVIKTADHLIDLGPEGGDRGGEVIGVGTPEELSQDPASYTGYYLNKVLPHE